MADDDRGGEQTNRARPAHGRLPHNWRKSSFPTIHVILRVADGVCNGCAAQSSAAPGFTRLLEGPHTGIYNSHMTIEQLRQMHSARPFRPFEIHLADSRMLTVDHPELLSQSQSGRTI